MLDGRDVWLPPDREQSLLRSQKIGFIFQSPSLLPTLSVLGNTALPVIFSGQRSQSGKEAFDRAGALLREVGLDDKLHAYPRELSAGQRQRVVIARSLINDPELLLADEPTSRRATSTSRPSARSWTC